jgi:hypothetical protein
MAPTYLDNADYWRNRADEARAQATQMRDQNAKEALLLIANVYERLAKDAEAASKVFRSGQRGGGDGGGGR